MKNIFRLFTSGFKKETPARQNKDYSRIHDLSFRTGDWVTVEAIDSSFNNPYAGNLYDLLFIDDVHAELELRCHHTDEERWHTCRIPLVCYKLVSANYLK